jgi:hypothetical protein
MPIFIPPISSESPSPIIRGWYNTPVVAAVPKVPPRSLTKITMLQAVRKRVRFRISFDFFNWLNWRAGWPEGSEFESRYGQESSLPYVVQIGSGIPPPPSPWVPGSLSPGVKRPGREAHHSLPTIAEVQKSGSKHPLPYTLSRRSA